MSDSEDSSSSDGSFIPFDEGEITDDESQLPLNKNYEENNCFKINGYLIDKTELSELVQSEDPEELELLNILVTKIVEDDNRRAFRFLLYHDYKVSVLNDEEQTAVHLIFYDECQRVMKRKSLGPLSFRAQQFSETIPPGDLLYSMIQVWLVKDIQNINYTDFYGLTYLHAACFTGDKLSVKRCILAGINVNACFYHPEVIYQNYTALHFAILNYMMDTANIVKILLKNGADVKAEDSLGRTPLHLACRFYYFPDNCGFMDKRNKNGYQDFASKIIGSPQNFHTKSLRMLRLLLKKHSDVNARDKAGNTPLHSIFPEKYNDELSRYRNRFYEYKIPIEETTAKFAELVNAGADVTKKNQQGDTILHLIMKNLKVWRNMPLDDDIVMFDDSYHAAMVRKVLSLKPDMDVNAVNIMGKTPLQLAFECMSFTIVKLLLDHGANPGNLICDEELFCYPDITPNFEVVRNVTFIIESLMDLDFTLTLKSNKEILQYLLHDKNDCDCIFQDNRRAIICYASDSHLKSILDRCVNFSDEDDDFDDLMSHKNVLNVAGLHIDDEVYCKIRFLLGNYPFYEQIDTELFKEFEKVKSEGFEDDLSIHDVISNHPYKIPKYIFKNFDSKLIKNEFEYFGGIITGHMTKAMLRSFAVQSFSSCARIFYPAMPELCCRTIGKYLSNNDILNAFLAVDVQDDGNKYLLR